MKPVFIRKFETLCLAYDVFIMDIFGVLHDGKQVLPGVLSLLQHLSGLEKTVYLLSNAPQRSTFVIDRLERFAIKRSLYQHILTAGEQVYDHLKNRNTPWHARLGNQCYFLGDKTMEPVLSGLSYHRVGQIEEADFILAMGPDAWHKNLEDYEDLLKTAAYLTLPMLCGNPDLYVFHGGALELRAGQLAAFYGTLGGDIFYHGKPHSHIYDFVLNSLKGVNSKRILVMGDSINTDILGANQVLLDSLLVLSPVTLHELGLDPSTPLGSISLSHLQNPLLSQSHLKIPTYIMLNLSW